MSGRADTRTRRRPRIPDPLVPTIVRRLTAALMALGAILAALGVMAVVGIERIDLPPTAVRMIAAALPFVVLLSGVVMLLVGALLARVTARQAAPFPSSRASAGIPAGRDTRAVREPSDVPALPGRGAGEVPVPPRDRAT